MAKESLWDGFKRRVGKLNDEALAWFKSNLKDIFKTADTRPLWMQFLQWVTGGVIKMDVKSLEKNKEDVWTAPRAVFGAMAGIGAVVDHFSKKDEEKEKRAEEAKEKKRDKKKDKKEKGDVLESEEINVDSGDHGSQNWSNLIESRPASTNKREGKKSHVEAVNSSRENQVTQNQL